MRKHTTTSADLDRIGYTLAKQVPAMERGFTIQTSYGDLVIDAEDAPRFVALARETLQQQTAAALAASLLDAAQAAEAVLARGRWIEGSTDPEAVALWKLRAAIAQATEVQHG